MNRGELITQVALNIDLPKKIVDLCLVGISDVIESSLLINEFVKIEDFGTFKTIQRKARNGTNPTTREPIKIPESTAIRFIACHRLVASINQKLIENRT